MKAIQVKYLGPTNYRGSRYKAWAEGVKAIQVSCDNALNHDENAMKAATELATKHGWLNQGRILIGGTLPGGDQCFVIVWTK